MLCIATNYKILPHICYCFPAPSAPYNLTAYNTSSSSITLNWTRPQFLNGIILSYEVIYYPVGSNNEATIINTSNTTLAINGLAFYTRYTFAVCAVTGGGMGNYSDPVSQHTSEDGMSYRVCFIYSAYGHTPSPLPSLECDGI